jgi:hypothetical protein
VSIEAINWALNHAPCENSTQKLVLFALANHAHPDGTSAFPSVATNYAVHAFVRAGYQIAFSGLRGVGVD